MFYTTMDLHKQIGLYMDKFDLDLDGKKIIDCINIIRDYCPRLHSEEELKRLAYDNLKAIEFEYGFKAVRLFIYDTCKDGLLQSYTGPDRLQEKYEKLLVNLKDYHTDLFTKELTLTLDVYIYFKFLKEVYDEEYGIINDYNNRLYTLVKTIRISNYDSDVIKALKPQLEDYLHFGNAKYYLKQDICNVEVLKMLFEHLAEENFDELVVKGYNMATEYDGYGNEYWIHQYSESWTDGEGHHYRSWKPEHTIDDYVRVGLP